MNYFIKAEQIRKTYTLHKHDIHVLTGVDLNVAEGERVAVVGRSGAGKSTLLHVLGGLDRPDPGSGRVVIGKDDIYGLSGLKRTRIRSQRIGFVFQSYHLLNEMDVLENVMLPARANGRSGRNVRDRAKGLLESVGISRRAGHTPLELSGGEQQRVAIARALINKPDIILADEPTGNLDETTGDQVLNYLFEITKAHKHTLVFVTHSKKIASSCDRVLNLTDGKLIPA